MLQVRIPSESTNFVCLNAAGVSVGRKSNRANSFQLRFLVSASHQLVLCGLYFKRSLIDSKVMT